MPEIYEAESTAAVADPQQRSSTGGPWATSASAARTVAATKRNRSTMKAPTIEEQIKAVERELGKRRFFYPNRVAAGKMKKRDMEREIACMEAVLNTLKTLQSALHHLPASDMTTRLLNATGAIQEEMF